MQRKAITCPVPPLNLFKCKIASELQHVFLLHSQTLFSLYTAFLDAQYAFTQSGNIYYQTMFKRRRSVHFQEKQLTRVIEKNTELTIQNSDLHRQIHELDSVSIGLK